MSDEDHETDGDRPARQVMVATESFACDIKGEHYIVHAGRTRVTSGHDLVRVHPTWFEPVQDRLTYQETEEMTDEPGRRRGRLSGRHVTA